VINLFKRSNLRSHISSRESYKGAFIAHLVTIVWCTEHSQYPAAFLVFVSLWLDLVTPHQHGQLVVVEELSCDIRSKHDSNAALRRVSTVEVTRVGPEQLDHDALITRFALPMLLRNLSSRDAIFRE